jgi:hypothetical protein
MRKIAVAALVLVSTLVALPSTALADQPATPGCVGDDMSHYARYGFTVFGQPVEPRDGFGHFHHYFAQVVFHGMGEPLQIHMSGLVPPAALDVYACGDAIAG